MQFYISTTKFIIGITIISIILLTTLTVLKFVPPKLFETSAHLGDTMNIVAPFINVVAAILILQSFREQKKSNDIQTQQYNFDRISNLILELQSLMEKLKITIDFEDEDVTRPIEGRNYRAIKVLHECLKRVNDGLDEPGYIKNANTAYIDVLKILKLMVMINKGIGSNNLDKDSKEYLIYKFMEGVRLYIHELDDITKLVNLHRPYHTLIRDNIKQSMVYIMPLYHQYNFNDID